MLRIRKRRRKNLKVVKSRGGNLLEEKLAKLANTAGG